jgi:hypothetical protein
MEKEWVQIFVSQDSLQIEFARQSLESMEIDSVIVNKQDSTYKFGHFELYVHRDNAVRSKQILKDLQFE